MQVFTPSKDYLFNAHILDNKRRNKQILENMQILSANTGVDFGWKIPKYIYNHPTTLLWKDDAAYLWGYTYALFMEYFDKHKYKKTHKSWNIFHTMYILNHIDYDKIPEFLNDTFCKKHQELLLEKDYKYYSQYFLT